jgi:hypothetical protein
MGRFPHPQTHVGEPDLCVRTHQRAYKALGMGGQNGCPAVNLRRNGPNTRNCAKRDHLTPPRPHPPPHPMGWFPHPQAHVGEPDLLVCVRTHQRAYRALGMGGQNGCPAEIFVAYSYHGNYQGFPHHTISYQFTIVMRYCTNRWTKS